MLHLLRILTVVSAVIVLTGCQPEQKPESAPLTNNAPATPVAAMPTTTTVTAPVAAPAQTAREQLERMVKAYQDCQSYFDQGVLVQRYVLNDQPVEKREPFLIAFERPNKIRLECYGVRLVNNSKVVRGLVQNREGILELPAPAKLDQYQVVTDETMQVELSSGFGSNPPQLLLLFAAKPLDIIQPEGTTAEFLSDLSVAGRACRRVKISSSAGAMVLWIDAANNVLRRVDYPLDELAKALAKAGKVSKLEQYAEFINADVNRPLTPETFEMEVPKEVKVVKRIMPEPPPLPPTKLLGQAIPDCEFTDEKGAALTPKQFQEQVTVLCFWGRGEQFGYPSSKALPLLQQVANKFKDKSNVRFVAVSIDDAAIPNEELLKWQNQLGTQLPLARDPLRHANSRLGIDGVPSLLVISPKGIVEHHWPRIESNLTQALPNIIELLLSGESTHQLTVKDFEQRLAEYQRFQQIPSPVIKPDSLPDVTTTKIAAPVAPKQGKLVPLWTANPLDIKQPGNMQLVSVADNEPPRLWVLDGWQSLCEFDLTGKLLATHTLPIPERMAVSTFRTATNKAGQRYTLVYHPFDERGQVLVLDQDWKTKLIFPSDQDRGLDKISAAMLSDLDGDGELELLVGYNGQTGLQVVSLAGERVWFNRREVQTALQMAVSEPNSAGQRRVYCPNQDGAVIPFDHQGTPDRAWTIPNQRIYGMFGAQLSKEPIVSLLGAMPLVDGQVTLVQMLPSGQSGWTYRLPKGFPTHPVEFVSSMQYTADSKIWLLAGPDGSVHLVDAAGQLIEQFSTGLALRGITGGMHNDQVVLFWSSDKGLSAVGLQPQQ